MTLGMAALFQRQAGTLRWGAGFCEDAVNDSESLAKCIPRLTHQLCLHDEITYQWPLHAEPEALQRAQGPAKLRRRRAAIRRGSHGRTRVTHCMRITAMTAVAARRML